VKRELAALAVLYLAAHLLYLPPTLEDIDSINFALGVRDFDVARHQPHPPGYPVFIALAKASTAILHAAGVRDPAPMALAMLSALAGTALIPLLFLLFRRFGADAHTAWWGMAVAVCSPLVWFTALRPLSDSTGLALATAAQVCLLTAMFARGLKTPGPQVQEAVASPVARALRTPGPQVQEADASPVARGLKTPGPQVQEAVASPAARGLKTPGSQVQEADASPAARGLKTPGPQLETPGPQVQDAVGPWPPGDCVGPGSSDPGRHATSRAQGRWLILGGLLCGLTAGVRVQTVMLMAPLFLAALLWPRTGLTMRSRLLAMVAAIAGVLAWAIPLLAASGGVEGYLVALGSQAGEDFSGVVMLWTMRTSKVAALAVLNSFVWPWDQYRFGIVMLVLAAAGALRLGWRAPRALVLCTIAFLPYAVFHLLFHETATMRYAMPLVVPVAFLAAMAVEAAGRRTLAVAAVVGVIVSLAATVPAARAYSRDGSPAFRVFAELPRVASPNATAAVPAWASSSGTGMPALGLHASLRRVEEWQHDRHGMKVLRAGHGREWLALVEHWRAEPDVPVVFAADPRRTDLALFDPHARTLAASERWTLNERPFLAGIRPGNADAYSMRPPGWMLDKGWALTAEVAGVTARDHLGPYVQPSTAWIRARSDAADLVLGGRQVGGEAPARLTVSLAERVLATWDVAPGFFFRHLPLPAGTLAGAGYLPLRVSAAAADGSGRSVDVKLEQFDLQSGGNVMSGFVDGWHEPEYNPTTSLSWHWMSEKGRLWVRPVGRDVTLVLAGESPRKYFDSAPVVTVLAGGVEVGRFSPAADFSQQVTVPAQALEASLGMVTIETSLWFTPAQRGESADQRHLALRIYSVAVR
jgi:hypothetical protein